MPNVLLEKSGIYLPLLGDWDRSQEQKSIHLPETNRIKETLVIRFMQDRSWFERITF